MSIISRGLPVLALGLCVLLGSFVAQAACETPASFAERKAKAQAVFEQRSFLSREKVQEFMRMAHTYKEMGDELLALGSECSEGERVSHLLETSHLFVLYGDMLERFTLTKGIFADSEPVSQSRYETAVSLFDSTRNQLLAAITQVEGGELSATEEELESMYRLHSQSLYLTAHAAIIWLIFYSEDTKKDNSRRWQMEATARISLERLWKTGPAYLNVYHYGIFRLKAALQMLSVRETDGTEDRWKEAAARVVPLVQRAFFGSGGTKSKSSLHELNTIMLILLADMADITETPELSREDFKAIHEHFMKTPAAEINPNRVPEILFVQEMLKSS